MRRFFLKQARPGDTIEDVYVITNKQIATTANGKYYIKCFVGDNSATVTARMWNATKEIFAQIPDNGFLHVRGRVENYQNNNQIILEAWAPAVEGRYEVADLLAHTKKDIKKLFARVTEICDSLQNRHVAAIVQAFLDDEKLMAEFRQAPAAQSFHHAYIGGLIEHTENAMNVGDAVCRFYPKLNRDLVLAGIFIHDIAKTWELKYDNAFGYTDGGQLIGHIVKAAMWIEEKSKIASEQLGEPIPEQLIQVLQHIILSHHGQLDFGSPKVPATPEAFAVHMIENMDAKLTLALQLTREDQTTNESNWTEYQKAFDGRLFKPDVAPAELIDDQPEPAPTPELTNPLFSQVRK